MNEYQKWYPFECYKILEERLLEVIKYIPLNFSNFNMTSPLLADIYFESCSMIDSIFRINFISSNIPSGKQRKDLTMTHYKREYRNTRIYTLKSLLQITPAQYMTPFLDWQNNRSPQWWKDYNELKHNRIENYNLATLENTLNALCAFKQILTVVDVYMPNLVKVGWIDNHGMAVDFAIERLRAHNGDFIVSTKLFFTALGRGFPAQIGNIRPILYECSRKMANFLGRTN